MSYATLLVYVDADGRPEHRVRIAVSLADKFNATLIGLSALPIPPPVVANGVVMFGPTEVDIEAMKALPIKATGFAALPQTITEGSSGDRYCVFQPLR